MAQKAARQTRRIDNLDPKLLKAGFLDTADTPSPGQSRRNRKRPIIGGADHGHLAVEIAHTPHRSRESVDVDVGRSKDYRAEFARVSAGMNLPERFHRQHAAHAVSDDVHPPHAGTGKQGREHIFQSIAGPHGTLAIGHIAEHRCTGGPAEQNRIASETESVR